MEAISSSRKFCTICDNMLYISVSPENNLKHYCRNCGYSDTTSDAQTALISETTINQDLATYQQYMTKNIKYDVTLPRVNNIKCPYNECKDVKEGESKVIYIKYDSVNMKYIYFCCKCEQFWLGGEGGANVSMPGKS